LEIRHAFFLEIAGLKQMANLNKVTQAFRFVGLLIKTRHFSITTAIVWKSLTFESTLNKSSLVAVS